MFSVLPLLTAITVIYTIMLTDFFDTMGTATGVAAEAGLAKEDGSVPGHRPGADRRLRRARSRGGLAGVSSNTTFIESAAGVGDGGRTGLASIVTGVLFLLAIFLSPIAGIIPPVATAPALILVGYLMFTQVKDIDVSERRGRHPGAADDDPDAAHLRHHGRHRRRLHLVGADQGRQRQGRARSIR